MDVKEVRIERIKQKMNEHGLTARDLAKRAAMSESAVSRILSGESDPRLGTFMKMADALRCDYTWLMGYGNEGESRNKVDYDFDLAAHMGEYLVVIEEYKKLSKDQQRDIIKLMKLWSDINGGNKNDS